MGRILTKSKKKAKKKKTINILTIIGKISISGKLPGIMGTVQVTTKVNKN